MTTDIPTEIFKSIEDAEMKVKMIGKKSGASIIQWQERK